MVFTDYWKVLILNFSEVGKDDLLGGQKVNGKMIFTDY